MHEFRISAKQLQDLLKKDSFDDKLIEYLRKSLLGRSHVFGNFTIVVITEDRTSQIF